MSDYNGWSNHATWVTKLWMDNDESTQEHWQERTRAQAEWVREAGRRFEWETPRQRAEVLLAAEIEGEHDQGRPEIGHGIFDDLLTGALELVDWREIAEALLDDLESEEPGFWTAEECGGCSARFQPADLVDGLCAECREEGDEDEA